MRTTEQWEANDESAPSCLFRSHTLKPIRWRRERQTSILFASYRHHSLLN